MGLGKWLIFEGLFVMAAGLTFFGGMRGIIASALLMSMTNALNNSWDSFWFWEVPLLIGTAIGFLLLFFVNRKVGKHGVVNGLTGGILSLVLFGVFATPLLALILWALVVGTGIIPKMRRKQVFWSFAPTLCRVLLGLAWIVYGNFLSS
ncbi:MAG: hypothetical protein ACYCVD_13075 [Desulfitobacteriaceae bacterium]